MEVMYDMHHNQVDKDYHLKYQHQIKSSDFVISSMIPRYNLELSAMKIHLEKDSIFLLHLEPFRHQR